MLNNEIQVGAEILEEDRTAEIDVDGSDFSSLGATDDELEENLYDSENELESSSSDEPTDD